MALRVYASVDASHSHLGQTTCSTRILSRKGKCALIKWCPSFSVSFCLSVQQQNKVMKGSVVNYYNIGGCDYCVFLDCYDSIISTPLVYRQSLRPHEIRMQAMRFSLNV